MKASYKCEVCGRDYETEEKALECEKKHAEQEAKARIEAQEKRDMSKQINQLLQTYVEKFDEFPPIEINGNVIRRPFNWLWL